jgi:hypothetical protein
MPYDSDDFKWATTAADADKAPILPASQAAGRAFKDPYPFTDFNWLMNRLFESGRHTELALIRVFSNLHSLAAPMVVVHHGAITAGGDGLFAVGNFLKGGTSGSYGLILAVPRDDGVVIVQTISPAGFTLGETLSELDDIILLGGDSFTGDTAVQDGTMAIVDHSVGDGRLAYIDVDFSDPYTEEWNRNMGNGVANVDGIDTDGYLLYIIRSGGADAISLHDGSDFWGVGALPLADRISTDGRWLIVSNQTDYFVLDPLDGSQIGTKMKAGIVDHAGNGDQTLMLAGSVVTLEDTKVLPLPTQTWTHTIVGSPVLHGCAIGWRYGYVAHAADMAGDVLTIMNLYSAGGTVKATGLRDIGGGGSDTLRDVCFDGERIYACGDAGTPTVGAEYNVVCYDDTGATIWTAMCGATTKFASEIYCDQRYVYVREEDGDLCLFDKSDGRLVETMVVQSITANGYVCADGEKVYVAGDYDGTVPGNVRSYTLGTGSLTFQKCDVTNKNRRPFYHRVVPNVRGLR